MNVPLITWVSITAFMAVFVLTRILLSAYKHMKGKHIFGLGTEREEFYIPGDPLPGSDDCYEDDDD